MSRWIFVLAGLLGAPIFDLLAAVTPASSPELRVISGHRARAFVAPFARPSGSARGSYGLGDPPVAATQRLWLDVESLLPVQWDVSVGEAAAYVLLFTYMPLDLRPPDDVQRPGCVR